MKIDLQVVESWERLNETYRQALLPFGGIDDTINVQVYLGYQHALHEICQSLAQIFPHRKTIAYFKHASPAFEPIAIALSKEGFAVKALNFEEMRQPKAWLDPIQKELLFFMSAFDDPITGELFQFPEFEQEIKDKRIFRLTLSHSFHRYFSLPKPSTYEVRILSLERDRALMLAGERGKFIPALAPKLNWPADEAPSVQKLLAPIAPEKYQELQATLLKIKSQLPAEAKAILPDTVSCLNDRLIFSFSDIDGLAFIEALAKMTSLNLTAPGEDSDLETTSLCRWDSPRLLGFFSERGFSPETIRGLIVIAADALTKIQPDAIKLAYEQVRKQQLGL